MRAKGLKRITIGARWHEGEEKEEEEEVEVEVRVSIIAID